MTTRANRPYRKSGCPAYAAAGSGYCEKHTAEREQRRDRERKSASERGYGTRWAKYRSMYLGRHPFCVVCGGAANEVDHIIPVDGADDPRFWEPINHQALCKSCHSRKTFADMRKRRGKVNYEYDAETRKRLNGIAE